jgi:hypothetical protein
VRESANAKARNLRPKKERESSSAKSSAKERESASAKRKKKCVPSSGYFYRWASPFSQFANGSIPFVSSSTNGQMTNFRLLGEQTVNEFRKIAWASIFHLMSPNIHVSTFPEFREPRKTKLMENGNFCWFLQIKYGNGNFLFVCCIWKQKTDFCFLWTAND